MQPTWQYRLRSVSVKEITGMMRNKDEMLILGLTGGIGCGKTAVLTILKEEYDAYIIEADRLAHELMEPGKTVYQGIVDAFGMEVLMDTDIVNSCKCDTESEILSVMRG